MVVLAGASLPAFAACSTSDEAPATPDAPDAGDTDAGSDALAPPDAPPVPCTIEDLPPGAGKKFCDLPGAEASDVDVPPEFCVREFTVTPVPEARVLRFAPNGDLFVAAPSYETVGGATGGPGAIVVLPDDDGDGRADAVVTFAGPSTADGNTCASREGDPKDLSCVHGLAFAGDYLYFTRSDEVRRFPYAKGARAASGASELVARLGGAALPDMRWTHTLERTKTGSLLVSRGRWDADECSADEMKRGAVFALHVESGAPPLVPELVADGFRNPMYLRCSPSSCGDCYASELSGDDWDGIGGREKLALLVPGDSWGFPCCVSRDVPAPSAQPSDCVGVSRELVSIPLHDTNFGLDFDRGAFPDPYKHGLFIALHGVFTSFGGTGVVWLPADPVTLRPAGGAKMFAKGFLPKGRATDVAFAPDGRLFVGDDTTGKIYWIAPRSLAAPR